MLVQMLVRNSRNLQQMQLAKSFAKFLSNGAVVDDYGFIGNLPVPKKYGDSF